MLRELRPDHVWTSRLQVYPGTPIEAQLKRDGLWRYRQGDYTRGLNNEQARLFRLESLLPLARALRLSPRVVRALCRLPADRLYQRLAQPLMRRQHAESLICAD